jgi:DNA-binding SARP family transcriptional activator/tetratricopeptide (TPR) repeat protein
VEFRILGPLEMLASGTPMRLTGRRLRIVLALLLVNRHRLVPLDYLVDAVWDEDPPVTARRQIQNSISALRRLLADGGADGQALVTEGTGYRLSPAVGVLDAQVFQDMVAEAARCAAGEPERALTRLRSAEGLWRGPALFGLTGTVVESAARVLDEHRLGAVEQRLDLELRLGRHGPVVGELIELVAAHPLRERLVGQLMTALHRAGRQAEALRAYEQLRVRLADELGVDPGAALRDLYARLLNGDPGPEPPAKVTPPAELPADVAGFTGRAEHLETLDGLIPDAARGVPTATVIAVIAGMGGAGKTALAVHWGHRIRDRFPDGQLYVDLRGYAADAPLRPIEALAQLLGALGVPAEQIPTDAEAAAGRYRSQLADRRVLVVLDNAATADQVRPLLPAGPGCMVVVTSRDRLSGLTARDGAVRLTLDGLTAAEARTLLARVLGADLVEAEPDAAAELAEVCSYLPLALRVTAANLNNQPRRRIAEHVRALRSGHRLSALEVDGDEPTGVRGAFAHSYRALDPDAQRLFRLLGLVPGADVPVAAAAALSGLAPQLAGRLLGRLTAAHLADQPAPGRYACHDLLREYAAELAGAEDRSAALGRLYDFYLYGADRAARTLYPHRTRLPWPGAPDDDLPDEAAALAWLDLERVNLVAVVRHAAEHGPRSVAWLLADTLRGYFWLRMNTVDWSHTADRALHAAELEDDHHGRAAALLSLADIHYRHGEYPRATEQYARALAACRSAGWVDGEVAALGNLGIVHQVSGQVRDAADNYARALARSQESGSGHGTVISEAVILACLSCMRRELGQLAEATDLARQALVRYRDLGSRPGEVATLGDLALAYLAQGDRHLAAEHFTRGLALAREIGDRGNEAIMLHGLAAVHLDGGDPGRAAELAAAAAALAHDTGDRRIEADALNTLARVEHRRCRLPAAVEHHHRALDLALAIGERYPQAEALLGLAAAQEQLGDLESALNDARRARSIAGEQSFSLLYDRALAAVDRLAGRNATLR